MMCRPFFIKKHKECVASPTLKNDTSFACSVFLSIFWFLQKNKKIYIKKYSEKIQKIIGVRKENFNVEKGQNWLRRFKNTKI
jgi:hypothetical protein